MPVSIPHRLYKDCDVDSNDSLLDDSSYPPCWEAEADLNSDEEGSACCTLSISPVTVFRSSCSTISLKVCNLVQM